MYAALPQKLYQACLSVFIMGSDVIGVRHPPFGETKNRHFGFGLHARCD